MSAFDNVSEAMALNKYPYQYRKKRTLELLDLVEVKHRKDQLAFRVSGGEKQRVAIARAMANKPQLIIADEPTGNVDFKTGTNLLELFKELNKDLGMSFLIASHSNQVASFGKRSLELRDGILLGEHGTDVDLGSLDTSRMVTMDADYRITMPGHVVEQLNLDANSLWMVEGNDQEQVILSTLAKSKKEKKPVTESVVLMDGQLHECLVCGAENNVSSKFCNNCGAKF